MVKVALERLIPVREVSIPSLLLETRFAAHD
jgi:hypothetical protein